MHVFSREANAAYVSALVAVWIVCTSPVHGQQPVTYSEHVESLMENHCIRCHQEGRAAPFPLTSFDAVAARSAAIKRVVSNHTMPPWLPERGFGQFNHLPLSDSDRNTVISWIDGGLAQGPPSQPASVKTAPDLTATIPAPYRLKAGGPKAYRSFVVPLNLKKNVIVEKIDIDCENTSGVVQQVTIVHDRTGIGRALDAFDSEPGFIGAEGGTASGEPVLAGFPGALGFGDNDRLKWRLGPNSELIVTLLLAPGDEDALVRPELGLHFAARDSDKHPAPQGTTLHLAAGDIEVPVGESRHTVSQRAVAPFDITVLSVYPRANDLCVAIKVFATLPDETPVPLLSIKEWQSGMQETYSFTPIRLPKGSAIQAQFVYDNTADNPLNPNSPPQPVSWGPGPGDELAELWVNIFPDDPANLPDLQKASIELELDSLMKGYLARLNQNPSDFLANSRLSHILVGQNRHREALPLLTTALKTQPDSVMVMQNLGLAQIATNDLESAGTSFGRAVEIVPELAPSRKGLASVLAMTGKLEPAVVEFERYLELRPRDFEVRNNLGVILSQLNRLDESENQYRLALKEAGANSGVHGNLAAVLVKQRRLDAAVEFLRESIPELPTLAAQKCRIQLARLLVGRGAFPEAKAVLEKVIELAPENAEALAGLKAITEAGNRENQ